MNRLKIELNQADERVPVPIVADGAIMTHDVADGKLAPLIILDATDRPDLHELVRIHDQVQTTGDVTTSWLKQSWRDRSHLTLVLQFLRPVRSVVLVEFALRRFSGFVDQIVRNEVLYVQPGKPGDRLKNTVDASRVLVEVNCDSFRNIWDSIFEREAAKELRRRGVARREIKQKLPDFIQEWRSFHERRMGEYQDE